MNTLTNIVLKELIRIKEIIKKNIDHIKTFQEIKSLDLSKGEIDELVSIVKKEISRHKGSEN